MKKVQIHLLVRLLYLLLLLSLAGCGASLSGSDADDYKAVMDLYMRRYQDKQLLGYRPSGTLAQVTSQYMQDFQDLPEPALFQTTYLYDRNGVQLAELFSEGRRQWVGLDQISPLLLDATVATEDSTFFENVGIDPLRLAGAAWQNATAGEILSGASTITMQVARNVFIPASQRYVTSIDRKAQEVAYAQELNLLFTKQELLEIYLNLLNYGHMAYGPEAAARMYFGKSAAELNMAEATLLAGIPQQPAGLDLFANFGAAKRRQRIVLDLMVRHGFLTEVEADGVFYRPVRLNEQARYGIPLAPHFVYYLEEWLNNQLGAAYTRRAGLHIYTTLDLDMQQLAQSIVTEEVARLQPRFNLGNAALVALKPGSAEVLAMVGSADFFNSAIDGQVNVTVSRRQPGSAVKPVLYATAMDQNLISPATILWDTPVVFGGGYAPRNYDSRFHGPVTVRTALANSYNVPAVKLISHVTVDGMLAGGRNLGINSLTEEGATYGLSLALGSGEISPLELTTAFHTFANNGQWLPARTILYATDSQGRPVQLLPEPAPRQALSPATAFQITDILSDNQARTPAFGANSSLKLSKPAAVKTGTTSDFRDNWTVGYTRYLVTGVWAGNSNGAPMRNSSGLTGAAPIWNRFMEAVIADPELMARLGAASNAEWDFIPPADAVQLPGCPENMTCREGGEYYSQSWLALAGPAGPLSDTSVQEKVISVYGLLGSSPWLPAYCKPADDTGTVRTMVRVASQLGVSSIETIQEESGQADAGEKISVAGRSPLTGLGSRSAEVPTQYVLTFADPFEIEKFRTMNWGMRSQIPLYLGPCGDLNVYQVQPGDYWSVIAAQFGLSVAELQGVNPHAVRANGVLFTGDQLLTPEPIVLRFQDSGQRYRVAEGDSWNVIAARYDVPIAILQKANSALLRPYAILRVGDELRIPEPLLETPLALGN